MELVHQYEDIDDLYNRYWVHKRRMQILRKNNIFATTVIKIGTPHEIEIKLYELIRTREEDNTRKRKDSD